MFLLQLNCISRILKAIRYGRLLVNCEKSIEKKLRFSIFTNTYCLEILSEMYF